jgi:hypothetical protein
MNVERGEEVADAICVIVRGMENSESAVMKMAEFEFAGNALRSYKMLSLCLQHSGTYLASLEATRSGL